MTAIHHRTVICKGCGRKVRLDGNGAHQKNRYEVETCSKCFRAFPDNEIDVLIESYL